MKTRMMSVKSRKWSRSMRTRRVCLVMWIISLEGDRHQRGELVGNCYVSLLIIRACEVESKNFDVC